MPMALPMVRNQQRYGLQGNIRTEAPNALPDPETLPMGSNRNSMYAASISSPEKRRNGGPWWTILELCRMTR
jgi:hypothetical protein